MTDCQQSGILLAVDGFNEKVDLDLDAADTAIDSTASGGVTVLQLDVVFRRVV